jgi:hypothetical protein
MILEIGKYGITEMKNTNTGTKREKIIYHRNIDIKGPITMKDNIIYLGYNEKIICDNKNSADKLFDLMHQVMTGTREEKLKRILKDE